MRKKEDWEATAMTAPEPAGNLALAGVFRFLLFLSLLVLWEAAAWTATSRFLKFQVSDYLRAERQIAARDVQSISLGLSQSWETAHGILSTVSRQDWLLAALARSNHDVQLDSDGARNRRIFEDPQMIAASKQLFTLVTELKLFGIVSLMDQRGDCIASSNGASQNTLVGRNFADRRYFRQGGKGLNGAEFAMGRATSQPGLFLSVPVGKETGFAGIVMGKFDPSSLATWLSFTDAFIADENGVVIFSRNPHFSLNYLPESAGASLPESELMALYKKKNITRLPITPWLDGRYGDVFTMEGYDDPLVMVTAPLSIAEGQAGVVRPVPQLLALEQARWRYFEFTGGLGAVMAVLLYFFSARAARNGAALRAARTELSLQHTVIDAAGMAMAIYDRSGACAGINEAMARIFASTRSQMLRANLFDHDVWVDSGLVTVATQVLETGGIQRGKWRIAPVGGKERWVEATFRCIRHDNEDYLLAIFADITESQWRNPTAA